MGSFAEKPLIQLTLARIREFGREPEAIFWTFFFPIVMALGLGIAFRAKGPEPVHVGVEAGPRRKPSSPPWHRRAASRRPSSSRKKRRRPFAKGRSRSSSRTAAATSSTATMPRGRRVGSLASKPMPRSSARRDARIRARSAMSSSPSAVRDTSTS